MKASLTDCREVRYGIALQPFFVTGLPRSRTAWLANLLTTDTTICYHDEAFSIGAIDGGKVVGFSGPQVCKQFTEVCRFFPNAPWLVVLREQSEALAALRNVADNITVPKDYWTDRCHLVSSLCTHHNVETVKFEELDDARVMRSAWAHLLPGIRFDEERFRLLCKMNIQQQIPDDFTLPTTR